MIIREVDVDTGFTARLNVPDEYIGVLPEHPHRRIDALASAFRRYQRECEFDQQCLESGAILTERLVPFFAEAATQ